jgi:hypothetical protein
LDIEEVETLYRAPDGAAADLFDHADPVIRVNDLITNAETWTTHVKGPANVRTKGTADIIDFAGT